MNGLFAGMLRQFTRVGAERGRQGYSDPSYLAAVIVPSNTVDLNLLVKAIDAYSAGGGTIRLMLFDDSEVTFTVPAGVIRRIPIHAKRVMATGTTGVDEIIGYW